MIGLPKVTLRSVTLPAFTLGGGKAQTPPSPPQEDGWIMLADGYMLCEDGGRFALEGKAGEIGIKVFRND